MSLKWYALGLEACNHEWFGLQVKLTNGHPVLFLGLAIFQKYNIIQKFKIDLKKLRCDSVQFTC